MREELEDQEYVGQVIDLDCPFMTALACFELSQVAETGVQNQYVNDRDFDLDLFDEFADAGVVIHVDLHHFDGPIRIVLLDIGVCEEKSLGRFALLNVTTSEDYRVGLKGEELARRLETHTAVAPVTMAVFALSLRPGGSGVTRGCMMGIVRTVLAQEEASRDQLQLDSGGDGQRANALINKKTKAAKTERNVLD
jgi:hypothetical protein